MDESRVFNPLNLTLSRSVFHWNNHSMGTCLAGRLIPAFTWNVLPGSEFRMDVRSLFKMSTPVYPTMDYLYADISFFFVPYKLLMSRRYASPTTNDAYQSWAGFVGAQDAMINMPLPASGVQLPVIDSQSAANPPLGLANYLYGRDGVVDATNGSFVNALPFLAYCSIWNENFREPNVQSSVTWNYSSYGSTGRYYISPQTGPDICISDSEIASLSRTGVTAGSYTSVFYSYAANVSLMTPLPVSVFHGYFGSLLPWPQRNLTGVTLPVGGFAPLVAKSGQSNALGASPIWTNAPTGAEGAAIYSKTSGSVGALFDGALLGADSSNGGTNQDIYSLGATAKTNLGVDLSSTAGVNIELFRAAVVQQHWFEDIARSGNRLDELEYGTFGVRPKDSGCDRPMYLGGKRLQLNVEMVASTNGGTTSGAAQGAGSLGDLGAFSHTNDEGYFFHQGFDTWGCVQCVFTIRAHNLIASGVDAHWLKSIREDWYWPEFANLGNQSVEKIQISRSGSATDHDVLGYQEYAEEWREPRDLITGLLDPRVSGGLGFMTYAHAYSTNPSLATVLDASKQYLDVDRTLAVSQATSGWQFIYQMTFDCIARIPVGKYSTPGLSRI